MHAFNIVLSLTFHPPGGPKAAFGSAVACGILLGVFEGVGVLLGRVFSEGTRPQLPPCESHVFGFFSGAHSHGCRHQYQSPCLRRRHHHLLSSYHHLLHPHPYNYPSRIVHCVALTFCDAHRYTSASRGPPLHPHSVYNQSCVNRSYSRRSTGVMVASYDWSGFLCVDS
jgi:hypothetical protein